MQFIRLLCTGSRSIQSAKPRNVKRHLRDLYGIDLEASRAPLDESQPEMAVFNPNSSADVLDYLRKTKMLVARTVATLDKMSPKSIDKATLEYPTIMRRRYKNFEKLPAPPARWTRENLKDHLAQLTGSYFVGEERLTDQLGLVSHIVSDLLRPNNRATRESLTADAYNIGIRYFLSVKDIEAARQLLENMTGSFLAPNSDTLNYFLWPLASNISANPYWRPKGHPLQMVLQILRRMRKHNVKANSETWNLAMQAMPMGFGKSFLVEEMARRNIKLNERSLAMCTALIAEKSGLEPAVDWALNYNDRLPVAVLNLLLALKLKQMLPANNNVAQAFQLLEIAVSKYHTVPNVNTMNKFLESFAQRRLLDWQLGTLAMFKQKYELGPSPESVQYLLEAALGQKETFTKYAIIGMILAKFKDMPSTSRTRILIRRAVHRAEERGYTITDPGHEIWSQMCNLAAPKDGGLPSKLDFSSLIAGRTGRPVDIPALTSLPRTDSEEYAKTMNDMLNWNYHSFVDYVNNRTK